MSLNLRRFTTGIQLVPVSSVTIDKAGEMSFSTSDNLVHYHNGTNPLALASVTGTETLTNKTLTSPVLNTPTTDTITGIAGGALTLQSASNQNLVLQAQGSGVASLLGTSVTVKDTIFTASTITGAAGVDFSIKSPSNQNLILQGQGTGTVHISPELRLDGSSSGYIGIKSTSSPTSYTMILPSAQGGANTVLQNDGAGNLSWSSVASGANAALSNLASVAINTDLLPSGVNNRDLGSSSLPFRNSFAQRVFLTNGTGNLGIFDGTPQTMPDGSTAVISISNTNSQDLVGIMTGQNTAADGTPSGDIRIESGNKTAGTGNSGNIVLQSGTSSGGTRGSIKANGNGITAKGAAFIGASNEIQSTALTNGQILVGSTGNTPVATTITAGTGISVTNAAGSITVTNTSPSNVHVAVITETYAQNTSSFCSGFLMEGYILSNFLSISCLKAPYTCLSLLI